MKSIKGKKTFMCHKIKSHAFIVIHCIYISSVPNSSDGPIFEKRRALFKQKYGR